MPATWRLTASGQQLLDQVNRAACKQKALQRIHAWALPSKLTFPALDAPTSQWEALSDSTKFADKFIGRLRALFEGDAASPRRAARAAPSSAEPDEAAYRAARAARISGSARHD